MDAENKKGGENGQEKKGMNVGYLFGIIMIVVYFGMAYLLLFSSLFLEAFAPALRYAFGGLFALYGILRAYRFIKYSGYKR